MEHMNVLLIGVLTALLVLIVLMIILLIRTGSRNSGPAGYGGHLPRELREEMYRSRQETIGMVQSSVKNMGDMLSQAQRESMELQSRRLSELNKQFARTSMDIEQRLENIRISMEHKVSVMTEENNRQLTEMRNTVDEKLQKTLEERIGRSFRQVSESLQQVTRGLGAEPGSRRGRFEKSPLKRQDARHRGRNPAGGYFAADSVAGAI